MRINIPYWRPFKKYLPRTLFWRTFLIIIVPAMLLQFIVCFVFFDRHWNAVGHRLAAAVSGETNIILLQFDKLKETMSANDLQDSLNELAAATGLHILYQPDNKLSGSNGKIGRWLNAAPFMINELKKVTDYPFVVGNHPRQRKWVQLKIGLGKDGLLTIEIPGRRLFTSTSYIFVLWMLGSSLILFTIAMLFMRNQIRSIRKLSIAVERFGKGEDVPNFRPEGALEVRQVGVNFLKMRERLRRQIEQRTMMLAGISHDLRTPVTRMKIEIEMLEDEESAKGLKSDLLSMETMLDGYLAFAKGEQDEKPQITYLDQFLKTVIANAKRNGCPVKCDLEKLPHLKCRAKTIALSRAIGNIIANGCKYGESVDISMQKINDDEKKSMAEIYIDDNGRGIPKESWEDVFKPFFRLEKSRNSETGGVGLGLSIAQDIINLHGGQLFLANKDNSKNGLRVVIQLPL